MKDDRILRAEIHDALDNCLSGIDAMPSLRHDIMRKVRGETVVKKKLSIGLVFAIVLLLAAATALAVTIWNMVGERAVQLEAEQGSLYEWDTETRISFVNDLHALGMVLPEAEIAKMNDVSLPLEQRHAVATKIIVDLYGGEARREDAISHIDVLEKEKGPFETWSLEDKAWYSQTLEKYNFLGWDNWDNMGYNVLPGKNDITREQAVQMAADAISSAYGVSLSDIPANEASVSFCLRSKGNPIPFWEITFAGFSTVLLTPSGEITSDQYTGTPFEVAEQQRIWDMEAADNATLRRKMEEEYGLEQYRWPLEAKAMVFAPNHRMPIDSDMDVETAISRTKEALMSTYGFDERYFDNLTAYVSLTEYMGYWNTEGSWNDKTGTWNYAYSVVFDAVDQPMVCGATMVSDTGEILETFWNADGKVPSVG